MSTTAEHIAVREALVRAVEDKSQRVQELLQQHNGNTKKKLLGTLKLPNKGRGKKECQTQ